MGQSIRVPDPVYERLDSDATEEDVAHGAIVREWMEKADRLDDLRQQGESV